MLIHLPEYKFCCNGNNAKRIMPLWIINRRGTRFITAVYQCTKCGEYSIRGESGQKTFNTLTQIITEEQYQHLKQRWQTRKNLTRRWQYDLA